LNVSNSELRQFSLLRNKAGKSPGWLSGSMQVSGVSFGGFGGGAGVHPKRLVAYRDFSARG